MLRMGRSLARRAALVFGTIYLSIFVAGLALLSSAILDPAGERHHSGPSIALAFAENDLREAGGTMRIAEDADFAALAARNSSLWLMADNGSRRFSFGPVPRPVLALFDGSMKIMDSGNFHVPGVARPLSDATVQRRGNITFATGGVDPATISIAQTIRFFMGSGAVVVLLLLGAIGLVGMLVAVPLLTAALKPLTSEVAAITPDDWHRRVNEKSVPKELLPLVRAFNSALERLATELSRRKQFVANVAHELRTPLAVISLQIEALKEPSRKTELQRIVSRLTHMVGQMLDVERLSLASNQSTIFDLTSLARDVLADLGPLTVASGYQMSLAAPERPVMVNGDTHALARAIGNLIGNAVAHGGGSGQIKVIVGEQRTLDVLDEGPGISEVMKSNLFEPFARERWDRDGCGLGLHLTREIMRAHGGDAMLVNGAGGAAFRLFFGGPPVEAEEAATRFQRSAPAIQTDG